MEDKREIEDLLRFEGIECKGYGLLPKFLMWDAALSIGAKALYAYYCSLAGTETIAFPRRETIVRQLQINKETFYVYLKELIKEGYISVYQERAGTNAFGRNIYTLVQNPKKLKLSHPTAIKSKMDTVFFSGIKSYGYGIIPRIVMQDMRLSVKEKALYAYLVVYTGAGQMSFLKRSLILKHLAISKNTYTKYLQALVELDYLTVQRCTDGNGKFSANAYILNHNPGVKIEPALCQEDIPDPPCPKNPDTGKTPSPCPENPDTGKTPSPCPKNPDTGKSPLTVSQKSRHGKTSSPRPKFPCPKNPDINNIYTNTSNNINNRSIDPLDLLDLKTPCEINGMIEKWKTNSIKNFALPEERILSETEADLFFTVLSGNPVYGLKYRNELEQQAYELCMDALVELCTATTVITLKGVEISYAKLVRRINRLIGGKRYKDAYLDFTTLEECIVEDFTRAIRLKEIKDPCKYMKACIWNALVTSELRFQTKAEQWEELVKQ